MVYISLQKIEYMALQLGEHDSMCFVFFKKTTPGTNEIMGTIEAFRSPDDPIAEIPFSNKMCDIPQPGMGFFLLSMYGLQD